MLRVGVIGADMVSRHHLIGWAALEDRVTVAAIADPSETNRVRRAREFGIATTYPSAGDMLAAEALDAVDIVAPCGVRAAMLRLAAARGLAILCSAPLGASHAEAAALIAETAGSRLMVYEDGRFRQSHRDAAAWLRAGRIGTVRQCRMTVFSSGLVPCPDERPAAHEPEPTRHGRHRMRLRGVLIHHLDSLRALLGELTATSCRLGRTGPGLAEPGDAFISLRARSGTEVVLVGHIAVKGSPATPSGELLLTGDAGSIRMQNATLTCSGPAPETLDYDRVACEQAAHDAAIAHFVAALATGDPFDTTPADNLHTLRLIEECHALAEAP